MLASYSCLLSLLFLQNAALLSPRLHVFPLQGMKTWWTFIGNADMLWILEGTLTLHQKRNYP